MPEGPLGFPRLTTIGPLTSEENGEKINWEDCPTGDTLERKICLTIKEKTLELMQDVDPIVNDLEDVNHGYCYWIADNVYVELDGPEGVEVIEKHSPMGTNHGYIKYNGRYYDAEVPQGVEDYEDLPFIDRYPNVGIQDQDLIFKRTEGKSGMGLTTEMMEFIDA